MSDDNVVRQCKADATEALHYFLNTLSFVPADKLNWSPASTARSAFGITAHCAGYSSAFAWIIRAGAFPCSREEFRARVHATIASISTIEQAEAVLRKGIAESLEALDTVLPEQVGSVIDAPQGPTPFLFFLNLPAKHLGGHATQIDYLQTCWGDLEVHF